MAWVDLPDLNVWFALSVPDHAHHERSKAYWQKESAAKVAFCSHTVVGLARLLSNVKGMASDPLSPEAAWTVCRGWLAEEGVSVAAEPRRCHIVLDGYVVDGCVKPKTWSDAYLAAFASSAGMRLVSFDGDFAAFPGLDWLHLVG